MTTISSAIESITPAIARSILGRNAENRPISELVVNQMVSDLKAGRWLMTGQPIIIADTGELNDGQHRLHAICKAEAAVQALVVRGVPRETRVAIDTGRARTPGDIATMMGAVQGTAVAGLARILLSYEHGDKKTLGRPSDISKAATLARVLNDDRLILAIRAGEAVDHVLRKKQAAFVWYVTPDCGVNGEFFEKLASGAELPVSHPILTLREWIARRGRLKDNVSIEAALRAWSAFREGRPLSRLNIYGEFPLP